MIDTGKAATKALREIKKATRWSYRSIAEKLEINHNSIWQISKGHVDNPSQEFMDKIEIMHKERCGK